MQPLTRRYVAAVNDLPFVILGEFEDQPELRLSFLQVRRVWNLSERECREALAYLVGADFLRRTVDGQYCLPGRLEPGDTPFRVISGVS